jgi:hypothetical protein
MVKFEVHMNSKISKGMIQFNVQVMLVCLKSWLIRNFRIQNAFVSSSHRMF